VEVDANEVVDKVSGDASLCLFRVAQEALNNATRHGRASAMTVLLSPRRGGLQLAVSDNGSGFDPERSRDRPSLGLASMRERVRLLHGELDIESTPGRGTTVVAWVPA
jgi:signal transduction histidine kinase